MNSVIINGTVCKNRMLQAVKFLQPARYASKKKSKYIEEEKGEAPPKNLLTKYYTAHLQKENGIPYDKKPFKMLLEKDRIYTWCLCGQSHTQPLCDATHRFYLWDIKQRPIRFQVAETKEYWLCLCKQTKNRPFCDGSHRSQEVEDACKNKVTCCGF